MLDETLTSRRRKKGSKRVSDHGSTRLDDFIIATTERTSICVLSTHVCVKRVCHEYATRSRYYLLFSYVTPVYRACRERAYSFQCVSV